MTVNCSGARLKSQTKGIDISMKRKRKKNRPCRVPKPAPRSGASRKPHMMIVVLCLVLGSCFIASILYLRRPKLAAPSTTVPVSNVLNQKTTEDFESVLFGKAQNVTQVKAESLRLARHLIERFPRSDEALFLVGNVYGQRGNIQANVVWWKKALHLNPQRADVYDKLAQLAKDQGDVEQALVYWKQGLKINPHNAQSLWSLANTYIERNQAEQAVDLLNRACVIAPGSVRNCYLLGQAYRQLEHYESALLQYERAIELDPNYYNAHYGLALTHRSLDQPERSQKSLMTFQSLRKAAKTPIAEDIVSDDLPDNLKKLARYYSQSYMIYKANKQENRGLPLLKRAIVLDPQNTYYQELLGVYYTQYKQFSRAIAAYQHALGIDPNQPLFSVNIGQLYTHMGQPGQAEHRFIRTIKDFPDYPLGYVELVRLYLTAHKNLAKTIGLAQRAVELQPIAGNYHLLSWTYTVNDQYPQAIQAIQRALALAPNNQKYKLHYEHIKNKEYGTRFGAE